MRFPRPHSGAVCARVIALGLIVLSGCQGGGETGAERDLPVVRVGGLARHSLTVEKRFVGDLKANRQVTLEFSQAGRITRLEYDVGDRVARGAILAEQDQEPVAAKLAEAEAALAKARADLSRIETLYADGISSDEQLETARLAAKSAEAAHALTLDYWKNSRLVAPFEGLVAYRSGEEGEYYNPMNMKGPVYVLVEVDRVLAVVGVPETDLGEITAGQAAWVEVTAYPGREFSGMVSLVGAVVDPLSRTVSVEITVPNAERVLKPGMTADVRVITREIPGAWVIPEEAVISDMGLTHVFIVDGDRAVKRPVTLGPMNGGVIQVTAGLDTTDAVVVEGHFQIKESERVRVIRDPQNETASSALEE